MSTAYWLRQLRPDLSIIVMDARGVASGATGRNGKKRTELEDEKIEAKGPLYHFLLLTPSMIKAAYLRQG